VHREHEPGDGDEDGDEDDDPHGMRIPGSGGGERGFAFAART
jgi:hypothetical protein